MCREVMDAFSLGLPALEMHLLAFLVIAMPPVGIPFLWRNDSCHKRVGISDVCVCV